MFKVNLIFFREKKIIVRHKHDDIGVNVFSSGWADLSKVGTKLFFVRRTFHSSRVEGYTGIGFRDGDKVWKNCDRRYL